MNAGSEKCFTKACTMTYLKYLSRIKTSCCCFKSGLTENTFDGLLNFSQRAQYRVLRKL